MYNAAMILLAFFLVLLNAFFVAAEFSFVKVRKTRLELLESMGDKRATSALFGVRHLDSYLSVCQLGITLASLGLGWIGEPAVAAVLRPVLAFFSITNPAIVMPLSVAVGFTFITILHVVFGELAPKSISIQKAESTVLFLARPMRMMYVLCLPIVLIMNGISNAVLRLVGMRAASESEESHSPEELRMLILDSSQRGEMDKEEGRLLDNIFSFYQKCAKDIMLHRMDVATLDVDIPAKRALSFAYDDGHTRYPIHEGDSDNIIGFVHVRDLVHSQNSPSLRKLVRAPMYAHETMHLDKLLNKMQKTRQQFCIVVDEYGVWQGILTMEDIMESIVGDIQDEFDNEEPDVIKESGGSLNISAALSLDELAEHMDVSCTPDTDMYSTIAGHFLDALKSIPEPGDSIEMCNMRFTVVTMDRNRIKRLRVQVIGEDGEVEDTPEIE